MEFGQIFGLNILVQETYLKSKPGSPAPVTLKLGGEGQTARMCAQPREICNILIKILGCLNFVWSSFPKCTDKSNTRTRQRGSNLCQTQNFLLQKSVLFTIEFWFCCQITTLYEKQPLIIVTRLQIYIKKCECMAARGAKIFKILANADE